MIWIKEDKTDNIYCCEIVSGRFGLHDIIYKVNCIIGSFNEIRIERGCNFYTPSPCEMIYPMSVKNNGPFMIVNSTASKGRACFDIEQLK